MSLYLSPEAEVNQDNNPGGEPTQTQLGGLSQKGQCSPTAEWPPKYVLSMSGSYFSNKAGPPAVNGPRSHPMGFLSVPCFSMNFQLKAR